MNIRNAVIFAAGTHNGRAFTTDHLDSIVESFVALGLKGKIPLKFGHADDDEQPYREGLPALGWVTRVARDGDRLVADLDDIPEAVAEAIKAGRYKFTSVEILADVTDTGGERWPYVLDAVALLGADRPAVSTVSDLRALAAARARPALAFGRRITFSRETEDGEARLRAENQRLVTELITARFTEAIRDGRLLPRDREAFARRYGAGATIADALAWINASPKPERFTRPASRPTGDDDPAPGGARADHRLVALTRSYLAKHAVEHLTLTGERLTFNRAAVIVARENEALLREEQQITAPD